MVVSLRGLYPIQTICLSVELSAVEVRRPVPMPINQRCAVNGGALKRSDGRMRRRPIRDWRETSMVGLPIRCVQ